MVKLGLIGLLALGLGMRTHQEVSRFQSDQALWSAAVAVTPHRPRALLNLGVALSHVGDLDLARSCFEQAIVEAHDPRRPAGQGRIVQFAAVNLSWLDRFHSLPSSR